MSSRSSVIRLLFFALPLLLLALPAGAGTGSSGRAKPVTARTLVVEEGPIRAFAQDANTIAWIGRSYDVHVRRLAARTGSIVGRTSSRGPVARPLALAGTRALWTSYAGGNSVEITLWSGKLDVDHLGYSPGDNAGSFLGGVAGDGATLVYAVVGQFSPCSCGGPLTVTGGGVSIVTEHQSPPAIAGIFPPVKLALSRGRLAVVPAASPVPNDGYTPRAAENGPVNVYDLSGRLLLSVPETGIVRGIALSWPELSVLVERPDGSKWIERYDARTGELIAVPEHGDQLGAQTRIALAATGLATGSIGTVYRVGRTIYLLSNRQQPKLVWRAAGTPLGLSVEGRRIAWAENVKGRGAIVALTLR
jgi:hypothetical protein